MHCRHSKAYSLLQLSKDSLTCACAVSRSGVSGSAVASMMRLASRRYIPAERCIFLEFCSVDILAALRLMDNFYVLINQLL